MAAFEMTATKVDGVVQRVDRQTGFAEVLYPRNGGNATVQVFMPAFFGGQTAPYPREGGQLHLRIADFGSERPRVVEAWSDLRR